MSNARSGAPTPVAQPRTSASPIQNETGDFQNEMMTFPRETLHDRENERMPAEFVKTTKTNEIPVAGLVAIDVRATRLAVANVDGTDHAFDDACTDEQCSVVEEGELAGTTLAFT
jgi:hypothetical protein